jgi:hypothetical protein
LEAVRTARLEAVRVAQTESKATVDALRTINPASFLLARLTTPYGQAPVSSQDFRAQVEPHLGRLYRLGVRHFEVHTHPNLQFEGWGRSWEDGAGFARWFTEVVEGLRGSFPEAQLGFPGVSPGGFVSGQRADARQFLEDASEGAQAADWVGVSCYWSDPASMDSLEQGRFYEEVRLLFPDKLLFLTECGNTVPGVPWEHKGRQYLDYFRTLRDEPGLAAAFVEALPVSGRTRGTFGSTQPDPKALLELLGRRSF